METGLLLIRVVLGGIMAAHGAQKLFGWFGGHGLAGTGGWLETMGLKPARLQAAVVGLAEFGGGALLVLGLLTPTGCGRRCRRDARGDRDRPLEERVLQLERWIRVQPVDRRAAIGLAFTGPGTISIDDLAGWTLAGPAWGLAALGISVVAAGSVLAMRRPRPEQAQEETSREEAPAA